MKNLLTWLRDPIWSSLGVLVAVIAIFLTFSYSGKDELAVVQYDGFHKFDEYFPSSTVKLAIQGEINNLNTLYFSYFYIYNSSKSAIKTQDFTKRVSVQPANKKINIVLVSSCNRDNPPESLKSTSRPSFEWVKENQTWQMQPELINSEESGCLILIAQTASPEKTSIISDDFLWDGRIIGKTLTIYKTFDAFQKSIRTIWDYFDVVVHFETKGILWFVILQCLFFITSIYISRGLEFEVLPTISLTTKLYFLVFFSITSSEILVSKFVHGMDQHPVIWPLLGVHGLLICYLLYKSIRKRSWFS